MTEDRLALLTTKYNVPRQTIESLERYVEARIPTGSFLEAVLSNDLRETFARADYYNRQLVFETLSYIYNELPYNCWGSPEKVSNWLSGRTVVRA